MTSSQPLSREIVLDKILGIIYGQALGDAVGLSTEFLQKNQVSHMYPEVAREVDPKVMPFPDYEQTGHSVRWTRGDWTDDTD